MGFNEEFKPLYFFSGCHSQTILGSLTSLHKAPPSVRECVRLADKDYMTMETCTPPNWRVTDPTVVLVHGLCGSHKSNYLQRLAKKFYKLGVKTVRVNLRGCGSGRGLARFFYHSGSSDDVLAMLKVLKNKYPQSSISLIGFSLGGNIVLKLAGELGESAKDLLTQVIAVSPPVDLKSSVHLIGKPDNQMYQRYFIRLLRSDVHYRHMQFNLPEVRIPYNMTIFEFDEYYIAPQIGFASALQYYDACSAKHVLNKIVVPCHILFAQDDPIIDSEVIEEKTLRDNISILKTPNGGHMGFLASPFSKTGCRWMDYILLKWVNGVNPRKD